MEVFYSLWFWLGIVAVVGIIAGVVHNSINKKAETAKYVADAHLPSNVSRTLGL